MGLLDDAIREHLELKRRHGGDPGEIERQEHEALGETPDETPAPPEAEDEPVEPLGDATTVMEPAAAVPDPVEPVQPVGAGDVAGDEIEPPPGEEEVPSAGHEADAPGYDEDPWLDEDEAAPAPPPESAQAADPATAEHSIPPADGEEDVLEETPEFLQETPEHDRLWFEQKPPRDFDWDR
jgi:hypothetical protein